ncbi:MULTISPECIES: hypothetical protein [Pseudoalteromonas]|uniref:hypothetical protein n=1 Tax=Pseudoalteromonas TaxID=53246 RepID=UPI00158323EB|nr:MULTISPECIES: hypothetical protein [Pseudoalteromonas]MDI4652614.1 hypothetical protein [Pseudoalteromonas shioyasakiensis]NUJ38677.1 hypothetical protein [Pseudoalteromonas sp. 0303]
MSLTNYCFYILLAFSLPVLANEPIWVKNSSAYVKDGQITLKRNSGSEYIVNLNTKNTNRSSQGRTANIMVVSNIEDSAGWSEAIEMSDGTFYIFSNELGGYLSVTSDKFNETFDITSTEGILDKPAPLSTMNEFYLRSEVSLGCDGPGVNCRVNHCYLDYLATRYSGTPAYYNYSTSTKGICETEVPPDILTDTFLTSTISYNKNDDSVMRTMRVYMTPEVSLSIPPSFNDVFGSSVTSSYQFQRANWFEFETCSQPECIYSTGVRTSATINYYFSDSWQGTGVRVGYYYGSFTTNTSSLGAAMSNAISNYVVGNVVMDGLEKISVNASTAYYINQDSWIEVNILSGEERFITNDLTVSPVSFLDIEKKPTQQ